ncbi:MAG: hypothetical protein WC795_00255 [Candidatus Paceibacterota bacterium]|jgi:hypothetical protein
MKHVYITTYDDEEFEKTAHLASFRPLLHIAFLSSTIEKVWDIKKLYCLPMREKIFKEDLKNPMFEQALRIICKEIIAEISDDSYIIFIVPNILKEIIIDLFTKENIETHDESFNKEYHDLMKGFKAWRWPVENPNGYLNN